MARKYPELEVSGEQVVNNLKGAKRGESIDESGGQISTEPHLVAALVLPVASWGAAGGSEVALVGG